MKMDAMRFVVGTKVVDLPLLGGNMPGPFVLRSVEGLGPPEVTIQMSKTVSDQAAYQGKTAALRQIIAVIGLKPNWDEGETPEQLRTRLYSLLTPQNGKMVRAEIMWQGVVQGFAQGQVQRIEAALFSKDPAVMITLNCDHPYILAPAPIVSEPEQRNLGWSMAFDLDNAGTAPTGYKMGLIIPQQITNLFVIGDGHNDGPKMYLGHGIVLNAGDRFVIDTRSGSRGVWVGPGGGSLVSLLDKVVGAASQWPQLSGDLNTVTVSAAVPFEWDGIVNFNHQPAFWGV